MKIEILKKNDIKFYQLKEDEDPLKQKEKKQKVKKIFFYKLKLIFKNTD